MLLSNISVDVAILLSSVCVNVALLLQSISVDLCGNTAVQCIYVNVPIWLSNISVAVAIFLSNISVDVAILLSSVCVVVANFLCSSICRSGSSFTRCKNPTLYLQSGLQSADDSDAV